MWKRVFGPGLWELTLLALVLLGLFWQFQGLRAGSADAADDNRYLLDHALQPGRLTGYGQAGLATLCHRTDMPPRLRWRWETACNDTKAADAGDLQALPQAMQADYDALQRAILNGEAQRLARVAPLAKSLAEGVLPESDQALLAATTRELSAYRTRYQMGAGATGSVTLDCAWAEMQALAGRASNDDERIALLSNRMALIRGASARLWWPQAGSTSSAPVATWSSGSATECIGLGLPRRVMAQGTDLARQVREGDRLAYKSAAMQRLLQRAPWLLSAWAGLAWILVSLSRPTQRPARFLPLALVAWAGAGAASGLVLPGTGLPVPWWAWSALAGTGVLLGLAGRLPVVERFWLLAPCPPLKNVSFLSLPLLVLFIGAGWWLVFDLAMNGHARNRYIALSQSLPVFGAFVLISVMPVLAHGLAKMWVAWASLVTNALRPRAQGPLGGWLRPVLLWLLYLAVIVGAALLARNWRQFTGDAFRFWLLLGVSWFFMLRAARWAQPGGAGWAVSLLPLLVHVGAVMLALIITDDLGPLLVVLFAGAVYGGAFFAQGMLARGTPWPAAAGMGVLTSATVAVLLVGALFAFTQLPIGPAQRVAERVESVLNPFSAENDQLAHVLWFRQHTPAGGYGLGAVPWCGTLPATNCQGMPAQTQSDYTFTAMQGVAGPAVAGAM